MDKPLKRYLLNISLEENNHGVDYVALVDDPAILVNWMAFAAEKEEYKFKVIDSDKQIISGPLMIPNMDIFRKGAQGKEDYYVQFSEESIFNCIRKFFKDNNTNNVNIMHDNNIIPQDVYMIESFIINDNRMSKPVGFDSLPNGTWFGSYKIDNPDVWKMVKDGLFKGFSVQGNFIPEAFSKSHDEAILSQIMEIINS